MLKGIDLSEHQATTPSLEGLSFAVLRASIASRKDAKYDQHHAACRAAGLVTMAYHYGYPSDIPAQVDTFLAAAANADFLWLDQEESGFTDELAQQFVDGVRAKGHLCGLYHSASGFGGVNVDAKWVADWRDASEAAGYPRTGDGSKEFPGWDIWQYDGGGADGIDNNFAKDLADLLRRGYVPKAELDAANAQVDQLSVVNGRLKQNVAELERMVELVTAERDAAPGIERERIAQAEAQRIREV